MKALNNQIKFAFALISVSVEDHITPALKDTAMFSFVVVAFVVGVYALIG